jgi:hypothetical protein
VTVAEGQLVDLSVLEGSFITHSTEEKTRFGPGPKAAAQGP